MPQKCQQFMGIGTGTLSSCQRAELSWYNVDKSMWWHNVEKLDPLSNVLFLLSHKVEDTGNYHTPLACKMCYPGSCIRLPCTQSFTLREALLDGVVHSCHLKP